RRSFLPTAAPPRPETWISRSFAFLRLLLHAPRPGVRGERKPSLLIQQIGTLPSPSSIPGPVLYWRLQQRLKPFAGGENATGRPGARVCRRVRPALSGRGHIRSSGGREIGRAHV